MEWFCNLKPFPYFNVWTFEALSLAYVFYIIFLETDCHRKQFDKFGIFLKVWKVSSYDNFPEYKSYFSEQFPAAKMLGFEKALLTYSIILLFSILYKKYLSNWGLKVCETINFALRCICFKHLGCLFCAQFGKRSSRKRENEKS